MAAPSMADSVLLPDQSVFQKLDEGKKLAILIAEDNPVNQMLIGDLFFRKFGDTHRIYLAGDGEEASKALDRKNFIRIVKWGGVKYEGFFINDMAPIAFTVMDIQMPKMNGDKVTAEFRERESKTPEGKLRLPSPIAAYTSSPDDISDKDKGLFSEIYKKPSGSQKLLDFALKTLSPSPKDDSSDK